LRRRFQYGRRTALAIDSCIVNPQLNAAIHRIELTKAGCRPDARALLARRNASGDGGMEALRILKTQTFARRLQSGGSRSITDGHRSRCITEEQMAFSSNI
jgi:hypothetical protein